MYLNYEIDNDKSGHSFIPQTNKQTREPLPNSESRDKNHTQQIHTTAIFLKQKNKI